MNKSTYNRLFRQQIDRWVRDAISNGMFKYDQIVTYVPSVYPSFVLDALKRLSSTSKTAERVLINALEYVRSQPRFAPTKPHSITLPVPHPLDFDWRFADESVERLLEECLSLTEPGDTICFVGTPSLFRDAVESQFPRQLTLIDSNYCMVDRFRRLITVPSHVETVVCNILCDPIPFKEVRVVVIDPPWYDEYIDAFLWTAGQLCVLGGQILLSMPQPGTRPGIDQLWLRVLDWSKFLELTMTKTKPGYLPYLSPPFERNALRAEGISLYPEKWRHGDLVEFTLQSKNAVEARPALSRRISWVEAMIRGVRIRVRHSLNDKYFDPSIKSVIPGDILPSVSRRDNRRYLADVWTSGNRIFTCQSPETLAIILQAVVTSNSPQELIAKSLGRELNRKERTQVQATVKQIMELVEVEHSEYAPWMEEQENDFMGLPFLQATPVGSAAGSFLE